MALVKQRRWYLCAAADIGPLRVPIGQSRGAGAPSPRGSRKRSGVIESTCNIVTYQMS